MKKQKKQNPYQEKFDSDENMTVGEASHHIGKKMTEKVVTSKRDYNRKNKHKRTPFDDYNWYNENK